MKIHSLILIAALALAGCVTKPKHLTVPDGNQLVLMATSAAKEGTETYVDEHRKYRVKFEVTAHRLQMLLKSKELKVETFVAVLNQLPIKTLKSDDSKIVITKKEITITGEGYKPVKLETQNQVRLMIGAIVQGINVGLAKP